MPTSVVVIARSPRTTLAKSRSGMRPTSPNTPAASICTTAKTMPATIPKLMPSLMPRRMHPRIASVDPASGQEFLDHHHQDAEHHRPKHGQNDQAGDVRLRRGGAETSALDQKLLQDSLQIRF